MNITIVLGLAFIGLISGMMQGFFGIGGGIIILPALVFFLSFDQQMAAGTTLAVLLPPVGLVAVLKYYQNDNVNISAAIIIASVMMLGGYIGATLANRMPSINQRFYFGIFLIVLGIYTVINAWPFKKI